MTARRSLNTTDRPAYATMWRQVIVLVAGFPSLAPPAHKTGLGCNKAEANFLPLVVPKNSSDVQQLQICGVVDWCYNCVYQQLGIIEASHNDQSSFVAPATVDRLTLLQRTPTLNP